MTAWRAVRELDGTAERRVPLTRLRWLFAILPLVVLSLGDRPVLALEAISVAEDARAIELTPDVDFWPRHGDRIQVSTAPGQDGIVRRIEVRGREPGRTASWAVFALRNESDRQLDRLIVAPHFRMVGSGIARPDLGASRVAAITPSQGFRPERQKAQDADVFVVTLDPGSVVTFVAELRSPTLPQIRLWEPDAYKDNANSFTLYQGMILGISGLLALFLTILFVVRGTLMFPAAASFGWAVLAYLCIDFGFWHRVFNVAPEDDQALRAGAEAMLAATLLVFLFAYLSLSRWHFRVITVAVIWLASLVGLLALAIVDAPLAAGIARISLGTLGGVGLAVMVFLAVRGYHRAILLIPTWILLCAWLFGAWMTVTGRIANDLVSPALNGGLVLLVLLVGLTVIQHAFAGGIGAAGFLGDFHRKALAMIGAGDVVFDWEVPRDSVYVGHELEDRLGLKPGTLEGPIRRWLDVVHTGDRDRFRTTLDTVIEKRRGQINLDFRLRASEGHYSWIRLRARPILGYDGEVSRLVGTLVDVTDSKNAEERLLHDAVHDNLTGLPNRELFIDRLEAAIARARSEGATRPTVFIIDLDRFRKINDGIGIGGGDGVLLTSARRLQRLISPLDTLARVAGDQFGLLILSETENDRVRALSDAIRDAIKAPTSFADRELIVTCAIGIASHDGSDRAASELIEDAEIAMFHAKRVGGDKAEEFRPVMRASGIDRMSLETDLRRAIEREELQVVFQPIMRLASDEVAGFEALARWNHPRHGRLHPSEFIALAEDTGLIVDLGLYMLDRAARHLSVWQRTKGVGDKLFASVNISSRHLLRHDLINDVKSVQTRYNLQPGTLKLEITESLVMENPEYAARVLAKLRDLGAGLSLDDFGTGYSSLAYLQRFPFDTIKVDQSFVKQNGNQARPVILRSIVSLAHDLGMEVVAEGAESAVDAAELQAIGCEYAQGFYFGQPLNPQEAQKFLTAHSGMEPVH